MKLDISFKINGADMFQGICNGVTIQIQEI
jgi:hypothetical protein